MKKISRISGLAGLLLIIAGGLGHAIAPMFKGFSYIPWVLGGVLILVYIAFNINDLRGFLSSRGARYGAGSVLASLLVLGVLVIISVLSMKHSVRYDMTEEKRYSLAPQTLKVLKNLDQKVRAAAFYQSEGGPAKQAETLLEQYRHAGDRFEFEMIDPDRNPARAEEAGITRYGTTVVSSGEKSEKLSRLTEQALTNAVLRVTRSGAKTIYFVTGHGEKDLVDMEKGGYSSIRGKLTDQNYKVEPLLLMREGSIPDDAAVVVVAGPQKDPAEVELTALEDYLRGGGKAMFLVDPQTVPGLARWLTRYRVDLGDDIIVDKMSRLFGADYLMPVVAEYTQHPAAENFNLATFYPLARTVTVAEGEGPAPTPLASTSEQAWGETDLQRLAEGTAEYNEGEDLAGPVPVAVVAALQNEDGEQAGGDLPAPEDQDKSEDKGKIIVFGDSDFASNAYLNLQGNADLFLNAVSWLAEEGDLVAVRAKKRDSQPLMLSGWQANLVFWVPVVVMPLLAALVGVLVFTVRRRRQ